MIFKTTSTPQPEGSLENGGIWVDPNSDDIRIYWNGTWVLDLPHTGPKLPVEPEPIEDKENSDEPLNPT